jgi:p-hydroxybenzoate 3-monooxygenase
VRAVSTVRTQVGIVGAGPAGLLLWHLLRRQGIDAIVIEAHARQYVEERVRAGVLEQGTVDILNDCGLGSRMQREGLQHQGIYLRFAGASHHIDFQELVGRCVTVYGQQEVVKDLIQACLAMDGRIDFEVTEVNIDALTTTAPRINYRDSTGTPRQIQCDFIAGCDGFHGICRPSIPAGMLKCYEREYPFAWLGILAHAAPVAHELIYSNHANGFALFSMRSPQVVRYYLQCRPDEDLSRWPDERIWNELEQRLEGESSPPLPRGDVFQKSVTPMRSFVAEPMQYGHLFLAGDATHIVPPTGAKGMNLAAADVRALSMALDEFYRSGTAQRLQRYSQLCLRRIWKAQRFSWWMTSMLHRFEQHTQFEQRVQQAELDYVCGSRVGSKALAENYVGLPFED